MQQFQIAFVVLFATLQDVTLQSSELDGTGAPTSHGEDSLTLPLKISSASPLLRRLIEQSETNPGEFPSPGETSHEVGETLYPKTRRHVPSSSYGRSGSDGETVYIPSSEGETESPANQTESEDVGELESTDKPQNVDKTKEEVKLDGDHSSSQSSQSDNGPSTSSDVPGDKNPLLSEEEQKGLQGKYSISSPGGSTSLNTSWTADKKGFHIQAPRVSVFGLGFGRRR